MRNFIPFFLGVLLLCHTAPRLSAQPNVLFISVDDLRPELGCYGHHLVKSPNIDKLAEDGIVFQRTYCQYPICGPSRNSLLTGLRPNHFPSKNVNDVIVDEVVPDVIPIPEHFKNNGYYTISNGKIFHDHKNIIDGIDGWSETPWKPQPGFWVWRKKENEKYNYKGYRYAHRYSANPGPLYEDADVPDNGYPTGIITDKTIYDLKRLKILDKPFFLAVGYRKPHLPFNAPKKYWDLYNPNNIELASNNYAPKDAPKRAVNTWRELLRYKQNLNGGPVDDELAKKLIHGYYACVSYTDAQIGRLIAELRNLGLYDNTIIILWGDHGWQLGEHNMWGKHSNFNNSLRTPLIIKSPTIEGGKKTYGLSELVDIYPTLCDLTGLSKPMHIEGESLKPIMEKPGNTVKSEVFGTFQNAKTVVTERYAYTEWYDPEGIIIDRMLFDHSTDPDENINIAELHENSELVNDLSKKLHKGWTKPKNKYNDFN